MKTLVVTCPCEGGPYSLKKDNQAPIRVYSDRTVEDEILLAFGFNLRREKLSRKECGRVKNTAKQNEMLYGPHS